MKNKILQHTFLIIIILCIAAICIWGVKKNSININAQEHSKIELNKREQAYIKSHDGIYIYVDENLRYLMGDGDDGFLQEYVRDVFGDAGADVILTTDEGSADCMMVVVTDEIHADRDISYTSALFQLEGTLFLRDGAEWSEDPDGVAMSGRTKEGKEKIKYDGKKIDFSYEDTAEETVAAAREKKADFILGDLSAIKNALGGENDYSALDHAIYTENVCIITDEGDTAAYGILDKCVNAADRHVISYRASQRWLDGNGPVYMKNRNEDIYLLILVIFTAVLVVFFIYYHADKNLYDELNLRMQKLTESKKELKTTFNGVNYYMAELDLEGGIQDINRAFYNAIQADIVGRKIWSVLDLDGENRQKLEDAVEAAVNGQNHKKIDISMRRKVLDIDIFPIESASGSVDKLLFMGEDVTNKVMAERQLLQDNKMIAVGQLAAGVAHEIRNPLGIIRNYCYVLKNMNDNAEVKDKAIEHIEKAVDNSGAIINNLLNFSRASSKEGETIDIEEHIRSLTSLNRNILKKKNINLDIICSEPVRTFIQVESLDMILINLIQNATDAMKENGNLTIKVLKYDETFEIDVQDTGTGIEEDILQEIFNPFFTTKGNNKGNGLGLYIVYNETDKLNGKIEVQSRVGEGSVFRLNLPLRDS